MPWQILDLREQCTRLRVLDVRKNVKYHLSLLKVEMFFVEIVSPNNEDNRE